jgi:hypothetical protein
MKKVVSLRMDPHELAKARDGLIAKGIDANQLDTVSQILRLTFYSGLLTLCNEPKSPPTEASLAFVNSRLMQKRPTDLSSLDDLINKDAE